MKSETCLFSGFSSTQVLQMIMDRAGGRVEEADLRLQFVISSKQRSVDPAPAQWMQSTKKVTTTMFVS